MAIPIRDLPVLEGKNAEYFYQKLAEISDDKSKQGTPWSFSKWKTYFEEQERLHPRTLW
jgi:hypothetical protein